MKEKPLMQRPPLAERLLAGLEETLEWAKGNNAARVTEYSEGELTSSALLTRAEWEEKQAAHKAPSRLSYNTEADALSIRFQSSDVEKQDEVEPGVVLLYDAAGVLVGLELRQASRRIKPAMASEAA